MPVVPQQIVGVVVRDVQQVNHLKSLNHSFSDARV